MEVIQYNATTYKVTWAPPKEANGQLFGYYVFQDKMLNGVPVENGRRKFAYMNKDVSFLGISRIFLNLYFLDKKCIDQ